MAEGITLKRIIDMDEATELSSSDYVLVDSQTGGPKKFALGGELTSLKEDKADKTALNAEVARATAEEERIEALFSAPTQEAVNTWLNAHPEATTTVQDGAVTRPKLHSTIQHGINENDYWFSGTSADFLTLVSSGTYQNIYLDPSLVLSFSDNINVADNVHIYGNGATIKRANGFTDMLFVLNDNSEIHNVVVDGNKDNVTNGTWERTVDVHVSGDNVMIDNIVLQNGCEGIMVVGSDCTIQNCSITNCRGNGIHLGEAYRTIIKHNYIANTNLDNGQNGYNNGIGCIYFCRAVYDTVIDGNYLYNGRCGIDGLNVNGNGSVDNVNVKIVNNTIVDPRVSVIRGVYQASGDDLSAMEIVISCNTFKNTTQNEVTLLIANTLSTTARSRMRLLICDNLFETVKLQIMNCIGAVISNNIICDSNNVGAIHLKYCEKCLISGNTTDTGGQGMALESAKDTVIDGNSIIAGSYPLYISSDSTGAIISNNRIYSNGTSLQYNLTPSPGSIVSANKINFSSGMGIVLPSGYVVCKDNVLISSTEGLYAVRAYGGSNNLIVVGNICNENASFSLPSVTTGKVADNIVMQGLV